MSDKIFVNKYIPEAVPSNLKWYERDGLLTYIDQLKYERFNSDPDKYLEKAQVINFDIIHNRCRGGYQTYSDKHYQTVVLSDVINMFQKERKRAIGASLRSERKDIFVGKKLSLSHCLDKN